MYLGLDLGTSSVKAVLFSVNGKVLAKSNRKYQVIRSEWDIEINPQNVYESTIEVLKDIIDMGYHFDAIGISSLGEASVLLDKDNNVLTNTILPGDRRGQEFLGDMMAMQEEIVGITGLPISATYTTCKLLWIKENQPEVFEKVRKIFLYGDFIAYRLTGEANISYALASRNMLLDIRQLSYSQKLMDRFGFDSSMFSLPVSSDHRIGSVTSHVARMIGAKHSINVYAGSHDQPCAALGANALGTGEAVDSIGTSECLTTIIGANPLSIESTIENSFASEPFIKGNLYDTMAYTHTAGRLLEWYTKSLLQSTDQDVLTMLNAQCQSKPSKLMVLPHFSGAGTPYMDEKSVGAIVGLNLQTTQANIYQGILESVSYEMRINLDLLRSNHVDVTKIVAVGGGARSEKWLQYKANIYNVPISTVESEEASALGAAMTAAKGEGKMGDYNDIAIQMVHLKDMYEPQQSLVVEFEEVYMKYRELYQQIKKIYS